MMSSRSPRHCTIQATPGSAMRVSSHVSHGHLGISFRRSFPWIAWRNHVFSWSAALQQSAIINITNDLNTALGSKVVSEQTAASAGEIDLINQT